MAKRSGRGKNYTGKARGMKNIERITGATEQTAEPVNTGNITIDISDPGDITAGLAAAMSLTSGEETASALDVNTPESAEGSKSEGSSDVRVQESDTLGTDEIRSTDSSGVRDGVSPDQKSGEGKNSASSETALDAANKASKKKNKRSYYLMLFTDSENGGIKQMGINQKTAEIFLGVVASLVLIILILIICLSVSGNHNKDLKNAKESLMADIDSLESQISIKDETIATQGSKITALSNTVNEKVADEKQQEKEDKDNHMPAGFPLSASTSYSEPDENLVITFKADEGTSVIASGDGVVMQVIADPVYEHCIVIDHENGYSSVYRNAGDPMVKEGDEVTRGQILYLTGANNKQVAYNIYKDKEAVNPLDIMKIDG